MSVEFNSSYSAFSKISTFQEIEVVPSKEQAQKTFWGLGDRFWMQMIDGKYHQYGPMVFDKALHKGPLEPGFFASLKKGCDFAAEHMGEKLTVLFYKQLNKELCHHFKGRENATEMTADKAGNFRDEYSLCRVDIKELNNEAHEHYLMIELYEQCFDENTPDEAYPSLFDYCFKKYRMLNSCAIDWFENKKLYWKNQTKISEQLSYAYPISIKWVEKYESDWNKKVEKINEYLSDVCAQMSIDPFTSLSIQLSILCKLIYINYGNPKSEGHERIVQLLFDRYNQKMEEINIKLKNTYEKDKMKLLFDEKVEAVADLFQILEWLHPYLDGQGRTDLVLQAKLLSENGLNPAILNDPYISTYSLFSEWKEYLINGMKCWKEERLGEN